MCWSKKKSGQVKIAQFVSFFPLPFFLETSIYLFICYCGGFKSQWNASADLVSVSWVFLECGWYRNDKWDFIRTIVKRWSHLQIMPKYALKSLLTLRTGTTWRASPNPTRMLYDLSQIKSTRNQEIKHWYGFVPRTSKRRQTNPKADAN